jgi:hypothetical protein
MQRCKKSSVRTLGTETDRSPRKGGSYVPFPPAEQRADQMSVSYLDTGCGLTTGVVGVRTYNATATSQDIAVIPR